MSWKDDHREHYESTDLTWDEYHDRYFYHESELEDVHKAELDELREAVETLTEHVKAVKNTYQDMKNEVMELRVLWNRE